jgi:hypothetical protein
MQGDIMEGANVEGVAFATKALDSRLKDNNDYHNEEFKSSDSKDMSNHNSML